MPAHAQPGSVVEYLADREGLRGAARRRFLRFARETLGYKLARPFRGEYLAWLLPAFALAGLAVTFETGPWPLSPVVWLAYLAAGFALAALAVRDAAHAVRASRETEWLIYCHLLRPVVLAEAPGLLDRNLAAARPASLLDWRPRFAFTDFLRMRGTAFWTALALGGVAGMIALTAILVAGGSGLAGCGLPAASALVALGAVHFYRHAAYRRLEQEAQQRSSRP